MFVAVATLVTAHAAPQATLTAKNWGTVPGGSAVKLYTLTNQHGTTVTITDFGAAVTSISTPDRSGVYGNIVLGRATLSGYLDDSGLPHFGATVGRCANRIAKGRFTLDGREYALTVNNPPNHLHGGTRGFDRVVWASVGSVVNGEPRVSLHYRSVDGDQGYPGTLETDVVYTLTAQDSLRIAYAASTSSPTVVNLTNHCYFNLDADPTNDILSTVLQINADKYTPVNASMIPTGEIAPVDGTPFDFRVATPMGDGIGDKCDQLNYALGYDHNWVIRGSGLRVAATAYSAKSGRVLTVSTTEPGIQFYTGNYLEYAPSDSGANFRSRSGFCLEAQHYPDSPNHAGFPSIALRPGQTYRQTTVYAFGVRK
jgi:aldose 1-epimerase